jgi:hypothetical protein
LAAVSYSHWSLQSIPALVDDYFRNSVKTIECRESAVRGDGCSVRTTSSTSEEFEEARPSLTNSNQPLTAIRRNEFRNPTATLIFALSLRKGFFKSVNTRKEKWISVELLGELQPPITVPARRRRGSTL